MSTRVPTVESPFKAPEIAPHTEVAITRPLNIPKIENEEEYTKGNEALTRGREEAMKNYQDQADYAVKNNHEAKLLDAENQIVGDAKKYAGLSVLEGVDKWREDYKDKIKEIGADIKDPRQKQAYQNLAEKHLMSLNNSIDMHVAANIPHVENQLRQDKLKNLIGGIYNDPTDPKGEIKNNILADVDENAKLTKAAGGGEKDRQLQIFNYYHAMADARTKDESLVGLKSELKTALDAKQLDPSGYKSLVDHIDSKLPGEIAKKSFQTMSGDRNFYEPDMTPNRGAITNAVNADTSIDEHLKQRVIDNLVHMGSAANQNIKANEQSNYREFMGVANDRANKGMSEEDNKKLIPATADTHTYAIMQKYVESLYKKDGENKDKQNANYVDILQRVREGEFNIKDIMEASNQGAISAKQVIALSN